jgi:hypothetical protein
LDNADVLAVRKMDGWRSLVIIDILKLSGGDGGIVKT